MIAYVFKFMSTLGIDFTVQMLIIFRVFSTVSSEKLSSLTILFSPLLKQHLKLTAQKGWSSTNMITSGASI